MTLKGFLMHYCLYFCKQQHITIAFLFFACYSAQVVVPDELKFPAACCVGIACQASLSIFNPSERWQQVAISIVNLSIDGEKVRTLIAHLISYLSRLLVIVKSVAIHVNFNTENCLQSLSLYSQCSATIILINYRNQTCLSD